MNKLISSYTFKELYNTDFPFKKSKPCRVTLDGEFSNMNSMTIKSVLILPTIYEVRDWIEEEFNISINAFPHKDYWSSTIVCLDKIYIEKDLSRETLPITNIDRFEAIETGICYFLENLNKLQFPKLKKDESS